MSQLITKFITDNAVNDLKFRARNNQPINARNAADSADVPMLKVNASDAIVVMGTLDPNVDASQQLGSSGKQFSNIYGQALTSDNGLQVRATSGILDLKASASVDVSDPSNTIALPLKFFNAAGTFSMALRAAALSANYTLTLPVDDGTSGQVLRTDGSGVLSWITPAAGSIGRETFTLSAGQITAQAVTLAQTPLANSVFFVVKGGVPLLEGASHDFSVSGTSVNFLNDIATGGPSALVAGDIVQVSYEY